jgi:glycosyltransferase involved in cell wall biosynthesis
MPVPELSVVVPCYNEEQNISYIVEAFTAITAAHPYLEVILVNNGSTDNSQAVFERHIVPGGPIGVAHVPVNKGYGYGILAGLALAKAPVLAWTHADLQTDPADVIKAFELYRQHNNPQMLVKGRRTKRRFTEAFFTAGMQFITNAALHTRLSDINAQPKLFSRSFYERIVTNAPHDFSLDLYFLYWAKRNGRIASFPVVFKPRLHGEAKGGGSFKTRMKLMKRTFKYIFTLRGQLKRQQQAQKI